jgi:hypothetical protein
VGRYGGENNADGKGATFVFSLPSEENNNTQDIFIICPMSSLKNNKNLSGKERKNNKVLVP